MNTAFWTHTIEILVMVGVAFLLGLLLGDLLWAHWRKRHAELDSQFKLLQSESADLRRRLATCESARLASKPAPSKPDDLKKIEGIGPKIEKLCNGIGLYTWQQLADAPVATLKKMLHDAGPDFRVADPATWPEQAALAAAGKWAELRTYQDYLIGGRDPSAS